MHHSTIELTSDQRSRLSLVSSLGPDFARRAADYDRDASFPTENWNDLRSHGLLGLCVPKEYGGLDADSRTYCLVASEIGKYCGSTANTFNMHSVVARAVGARIRH